MTESLVSICCVSLCRATCFLQASLHSSVVGNVCKVSLQDDHWAESKSGAAEPERVLSWAHKDLSWPSLSCDFSSGSHVARGHFLLPLCKLGRLEDSFLDSILVNGFAFLLCLAGKQCGNGALLWVTWVFVSLLPWTLANCLSFLAVNQRPTGLTSVEQ